ncbi:MAG: thymidylate synthase [Nanoarchaeota archaeon]
MEEEWPIYKKELLILGNQNSNVSICTLWTPKENVLRKISKNNFLITGQCYSKSEGPSLILRHALLNKKLRYIILYGANVNKTAEILLAIKNMGVDENHKVIGFSDAEIEKEITLDAINRFRQNVEIIDKRDLELEELNNFIESLPKKESWGEPELFPRIPPKKPEFFPSEETGFVIRGKTVGNVWLEILQTIRKFGKIKKSQYSDDQQEIVNLTSIITDEDPNNLSWEEWFQFSKEHFQEYLPQLMTSDLIGDVEYTYGSRLRNFKGINQIESIIEELKKAIYSRRAVGVTWDIEKDHNNSHCPCLDLIQPLVQDKLHMTVYLRSNDMFKAYPENALALRMIQNEIAQKVGVALGSLIIISNSAHIYSSDWEKVKNILEQYSIKQTRQSDPRGNILIETENKKIKIIHQSPEGVGIDEIYAENSLDACSKINAKKMISQINHSLDIGGEIAKAEIAIKNNLKYVQDKPLEIRKKGKIILVEGTDCSGKQTQTELLLKKLNSEGIPCKLMSFPRYNTPTGRIVGQSYLGKVKDYWKGDSGWFGEADSLDPKIASLYYAADRRASVEEIDKILDSGCNLILDRYYTSNMAHQGGKIKNIEERKKIFEWLQNLELDILKLPKEDIAIFLHMPLEVSKILRTNRTGENLDNHENNEEHLRRAEETYNQLSELYNWKNISCAPNKTIESLKTPEEIHEEVYSVVKDFLTQNKS